MYMCGRPKTDKMWQLAHVWNLWTKFWHQSSGFQEMQRNQSGSFVVIDVYKWAALPVVAIITNTCLLQTPHIPRQCHQQHHQCEQWAGAEATLTDLAAASLFHTINTSTFTLQSVITTSDDRTGVEGIKVFHAVVISNWLHCDQKNLLWFKV